MEAHAATTTLNSLPDELLLAIAEHLDRPARYSLIRASQRLFRVVLPLVYSRRVKLSQRNIPAELVSGASPRLPFYLHAIRKAWLVFSAEDELAVLQNNGADDRVLAFLELFGHNLISLVVMQRLPLGCVPWFEDHDMGDELPESFESSVHLPLRIALALQRCVKVASLDFVGLKFTAATLLIPFLPSARFKHQTGLGSVAGIRELGFERCTFADDILPHHLALFTERLGQLGPSNSDSPSPSRRPRFEEMPSLKDLSIKEPREFSPSRVTFDVLGHSIRELARFEPRPSTPLPEPTNGTIIDYNQQLPSWESNPDPLYSIKRAVKTSTVPLERVYMSHRPMWAPQTPLNNPPKQFRSLALIRNIGLDMNKVICMVQGGWCSHLDELIVLNLAADDEDLQCLGKVCPFLTRLDVRRARAVFVGGC